MKMLTEFKYLSDGRKVQVVGKLNSQEIIVQEIFVTNSGDEIPSGESFTTKSIHDEKVISWKEKDLEKVERRVNDYKEKQKKAEEDYRLSYEKLKGITEVLKQSQKLVNLFPDNELDILTSFMTGTIEYLVTDEYVITAPVKMIDEIIYFDNYRGSADFDGIKLCSFLGRSNGVTDFSINRYNDGSGSEIKVYPFTNLDDAVLNIKERAEKLIRENRLSSESHEVCVGLGISFDDELTEKYTNHLNEKINKRIEDQIKIIEKSKKNIEGLNTKLRK